MPFLRRDEATAAVARGAGGASSSAIFWRLGRREAEGFDCSGSGAGLGSRAGTFRFFEVPEVRVEEVVAVGPTEAVDGSEELAACLADALVILPDMMVSTWL